MTCQVTGTAFITGGGSGTRCKTPLSLSSQIANGLGIGKSTALTLAQNGIGALALLDLNLPLLEATRDEIRSRFPHAEVEILRVDVADEASVQAAVHAVVQRFGRIDIGINCAGISGSPTPTHEMSLAEWQKVVDVNQTGVWLCQRALIRQMLQQE